MKLLFLLITSLFIISCGSSNKCDGVKCDDWLECNTDNGKCENLKEEFCLKNQNCDTAKKEVCNLDTHKCKLPHFIIEESSIIDTHTNLMWQNTAIGHAQREKAIETCNNMKFLTYDDWYLADMTTLGKFHKETNEEGIVPKQAFDRCLAEVATDGYVKTKKGAQEYGGNPGDEFNFSGGANFRCVRNNK
jgi:hypothetical protein